MTNWTCSGALILPAFSISTALKIIDRSNASISGLTPCASISAGQPVDQVGRVLVDPGREIARAGGERGHVRPERQHAAALLAGARAAAGRELQDHAGAVPAQALLQPGELLRVGGRSSGRRCGRGDAPGWRRPRTPPGSISTCSAMVIGTAGLFSLLRQGARDRDRDDAGGMGQTSKNTVSCSP